MSGVVEPPPILMQLWTGNILQILPKKCGFSDDQSNHASTFDPVSENGIELPEFAESVEQVEQMIENRWSHIRFGEYILADREDLRNVVSIVREAGYSYDPREKTWYI